MLQTASTEISVSIGMLVQMLVLGARLLPWQAMIMGEPYQHDKRWPASPSRPPSKIARLTSMNGKIYTDAEILRVPLLKLHCPPVGLGDLPHQLEARAMGGPAVRLQRTGGIDR